MSVISKTARKFLKSILPDSVRHRLLVLENVHSYGGLFEAESMFYRWVGKAVTRKTHSRVHTGPFRGMRYIHHAVHVQSSAYCPKLLGTYEQELHSVVDSLRTQRPYQRVINIGAGEGYYAVGLALHLPQSRLTAFEADPDSRKGMMSLAGSPLPRLLPFCPSTHVWCASFSTATSFSPVRRSRRLGSRNGPSLRRYSSPSPNRRSDSVNRDASE